MLTSTANPVRFASRTIYAQCLTDQAIIACTLERYRLEFSVYPESLAAVKRVNGDPLPLDVIDGQPMRYRRTENGRYALWSVALDEKDDGGVRGPKQAQPWLFNPTAPDYKGDWVWDFSGAGGSLKGHDSGHGDTH
jgi:hypothetical protein